MNSPTRDPPAPASSRLFYVDRLKALAVVAVVVIHVSQVFNPWDEWHVTADDRSRVVGEIAVFFAPWIMPLLMLLAGMTAWHAVRLQGNAQYLRQKISRILVPLMIGTLVLVPPQVYLERRYRGQFSGGLLDFYPRFFEGVYPNGNLSWHHLWFLVHLFAYSLIALPLFRAWDAGKGRPLIDFVVRRVRSRHGILWLSLPLMSERLALWTLFPERHMLAADWSNHAILFVAYLYGYAIVAEPAISRAIDEQWRDGLAVALACSVCLAAGTWMGIIPAKLPGDSEAGNLAFWTLYAVTAWAWTVGLLGVARRWLDHPGSRLESGHRAYLWYLVHQPIVIGFAVVIAPLSLSIAQRFFLILLLGGAATVLTAELLESMLGKMKPRRVVRAAAPFPSHLTLPRASTRAE